MIENVFPSCVNWEYSGQLKTHAVSTFLSYGYFVINLRRNTNLQLYNKTSQGEINLIFEYLSCFKPLTIPETVFRFSLPE